MRIAWTGPVGHGGGVPGMGMLMLRELLRRGVEVDLYLATDKTEPVHMEAMPGLNIIVRRSGWQWKRWYSRTAPLAFFSSMLARGLNSTLLGLRLLRQHRRKPYDAVFQLSQTELFLLGRAGRFGPPIVVHPCSHAAGELRWHRAERDYALRSQARSVHLLMRTLLGIRSRLQPGELGRADLVVGPSERFIELVHEDYGVPRGKLRVLRHPVDLDRFIPSTNGHHRPLTLLFVSHISASEGLEDIVELSHRLADLAGSVRLLVVGGVTLWSDYSAHLADLHPGVAKYIGAVPSSEMASLMRSAALVVVPSRYEPGSIVTGEALASGVPVVLSDEVGPSEVIAGPHVRTYRPGAVDELEAAVRSLLDAFTRDPRGLRASARADAESNFAPSGVVDELIDIIGSVRSPRGG